MLSGSFFWGVSLRHFAEVQNGSYPIFLFTPPWPEHWPEAVLLSLNVPSLHSAVEPLGGFAALLAAVFAGGVILLAAILAGLLAAVLAAVLDIVFDAVFDAVFDMVFDIVFDAVFDIVLALLALAFELLAVGAPPHANVIAISESSVIRSKSLFFIY